MNKKEKYRIIEINGVKYRAKPRFFVLSWIGGFIFTAILTLILCADWYQILEILFWSK